MRFLGNSNLLNSIMLFLKRKQSLKQAPSTLIISSGGCASTTLISHIGKFCNVNCANDSDGLKHLPNPNVLTVCRDTKLLYIYDDPKVVLQSIIRRGWLRRHGAKLCGFRIYFANREAAKKQLFEALVAQHESVMKFQLLNGEEKCRTQPFHSIWSNKHELSDFLSIDNPSFFLDFPRQKKRRKADCRS